MKTRKNEMEKPADSSAGILKTNSGRTIPVVMSFDSNYYFPTCVTVWSIMEHANPKDRYQFFFLADEKVSGTDRGVFAAIAEKYPNFSWEYISVDTDLFAETRRTVEHISVPTYYRLLIPELITGYDRCIYLDSDMLVLGDMASILDECDAADSVPFSRCYIAAVRDMLMQVKELEFTKTHLDSIGFENRRDYFNAGILVLNLARLQADRMVDSFLPLLKYNYLFADQDILNIACEGKILYLPARYNLVSSYIGNWYNATHADLNEEDWQDTMLRRPFICHFAGPEKPWNLVETVWEYRWYETAKRLPRTEYVKEQLRVIENNIADRLREDLLPAARCARELILYGFSTAGFRLCGTLLTEGFTNIRCFCDKNPSKTGLSHMGIPCMGRDILSEITEDTIIIICPQKSWRGICRELTEAGIDIKKLTRFRGRDSRIVSIDEGDIS